MKQFWTLAIILMLLVVYNQKTQAQIIKGEALVGLNLTQVEGDEVAGFRKPGVNLGLGAMIPFGEKWDVSMEISYTQKGARQKDQYSDSTSSGEPLTGAYKLRLNYVEVPVMIHFTDKDFLTIGAGFSWGRLVGVQEWEHGQLIESTTLNSGTYDKNDFNYVIDLRVKVKGPLKFGVRYQNSMMKIRTRTFENIDGETWERNQYNKVLSFRLIYMFNETQSRMNKNQPAN